MRFLKKPAFLLSLLSLFISFLISHQVLSLLTLPTWDEAHNTYYGYLMYRAFKNRGLLSAWQLAYGQVFYPPLQSILVGIFTLFFGFSIRNVRLLSLATLPLSILLIFKLGKFFSKKRGLTLGVLAALTTLTSPMLLFFSATALKEQLGLFFTLLICSLFFSLLETKPKNKGRLIFLSLAGGVALFLLHLLKYNYGLLVFFVLAAEWLFFHRRPAFISLALGSFLFLPSILGMTLWTFSRPDRFLVIFNYLKNPWQWTLPLTSTLGHLLFVPASLFSSYPLSPIIVPFLFLGFLKSLTKLKNSSIRVHTLLFLANAIPLTFHFGNQQERFLLTTFPSFVLVGIFGLLLILESLKKRVQKLFYHRPALAGLLLSLVLAGFFVLLFDLFRLPKLVRQSGGHQIFSPIFNQVDYRDTFFVFDRRKWPKVIIDPQRPSTADAINFVLKNIDVSKPIKVIGTFNELSPLLFDFFFQKERDKPFFEVSHPEAKEFIVTLEVFPQSPFYTQDFIQANAWQQKNISQIKKDKALKLVGKKSFDELKLEVSVFRR